MVNQKIFLSHKGVDEEMVRDFKDTLTLLGFEPWFAEESMAAGVNPDRAILKGFEESCAAVFFITPAFKDVSWLADEIEHAKEQKRQKKGQFLIISLVFKSRNGERGVVPPLLRSYVYKEPETDLEALREIVRALPVCVGMVDWKDKAITNARQYQAINEALNWSKEPEYTDAKRIIAEWADKHPGAFQPDQVLSSKEFDSKLQDAWKDYQTGINRPLHQARGVFNKDWDRLVDRFEANQFSYHEIFNMIGDNLRLLSITDPIEILLAQKLGTGGKPRLGTLLARFSSWVESDLERTSEFAKKGFRAGQEGSIWTQKWPWRC